MRAATMERMISIMAEAGLAVGLSVRATCRGIPQPSRCPNLDIGWRKRPSPATQPVLSDLQCGSSYWHAWC